MLPCTGAGWQGHRAGPDPRAGRVQPVHWRLLRKRGYQRPLLPLRPPPHLVNEQSAESSGGRSRQQSMLARRPDSQHGKWQPCRPLRWGGMTSAFTAGCRSGQLIHADSCAVVWAAAYAPCQLLWPRQHSCSMGSVRVSAPNAHRSPLKRASVQINPYRGAHCIYVETQTPKLLPDTAIISSVRQWHRMVGEVVSKLQ